MTHSAGIPNPVPLSWIHLAEEHQSVEANRFFNQMCLSWFTGQLNGKHYFAHAGGGGYCCEIRIYRDLGIGSVIMQNRTGLTNERFLDQPGKYIINN